MLDILSEIIRNAQVAPIRSSTPRHLRVRPVAGKAMVCIGARRSGKSTYMFQQIQRLLADGVAPENILYLNFVDDRLHDLRYDNLDSILEAYFSLYPEKRQTEKVHCFFDEIQMVDGWELFVDRLMRTEDCQVYLTGSSAHMLSREVATHMRGRALSWELFPFSFREFLDHTGVEHRQPLSSKQRLLVQKAFGAYWEAGGFPEAAGLDGRLRVKVHQEYFAVMLFRDLIERHDISHPRAAADLAHRLIDNAASPYSVNSLTGYLKSLGHRIPKASVSDYVQWFEDATLAAEVGAEAVIHAGDFGFFDQGSADRLSDRELRLQVAHSMLPQTEKDRPLRLSRDGMIEAIRRGRLLGEFQELLDGTESLDVPVYAVWGNHEDIHVVRRLHRGEMEIENLHIVDHRRGYRVGPALVYGLGENLLPGAKMLQRPLAGGAGKIWSTLSQYRELVGLADQAGRSPGPRILLSHVSPGKEPFVELVAARTRADVTVSGHMGAPTCMVWNPFTVLRPQEAEKRLREGLAAVEQRCLAAAPSKAPWIAESLTAIGSVLEDSDVQGKGAGGPRWYRRMMHVNLPDAHVGYAVLDVGETGWKLQTCTR